MMIAYLASYLAICFIVGSIDATSSPAKYYGPSTHDAPSMMINEHLRFTKKLISRTAHCDSEMQIILGAAMYQSQHIVDDVLRACEHNTIGRLTGDDLVYLEELYFGETDKHEHDYVTSEFHWAENR